MRPSFRPSPDLYPFVSRWHDSAVGPVHYLDEGEGQPIVFLHGNPTWSFLYRHLIRELRGEFRCVAVDYPGFGLSVRPPRYGYTPQEQAGVVGELVDAIGLEGFVVAGHDWGGPIGTSVAAGRADRVAGLVLGNTWFWPSDLRARVFGRVMSSAPLRRAVLRRNLFVERLLPSGIVRRLSDEEMDHYRAVQPTPDMRVGVAELPRQLTAAGHWLEQLESEVRSRLGDKRVLVTWPMRDAAFPAKQGLPRMRATFRELEVVELADAKHFFPEDASPQVAAAIRARFGAET